MSKNTALRTLGISNTKLTELDLSANWKLKNLQSNDNPQLATIWLKEGIILESCEVEEHTEIKYK